MGFRVEVCLGWGGVGTQGTLGTLGTLGKLREQWGVLEGTLGYTPEPRNKSPVRQATAVLAEVSRQAAASGPRRTKDPPPPPPPPPGPHSPPKPK